MQTSANVHHPGALYKEVKREHVPCWWAQETYVEIEPVRQMGRRRPPCVLNLKFSNALIIPYPPCVRKWFKKARISQRLTVEYRSRAWSASDMYSSRTEMLLHHLPCSSWSGFCSNMSSWNTRHGTLNRREALPFCGGGGNSTLGWPNWTTESN